MGHHLDGLTKIVAAAFFIYYGFVYSACGERIRFCCLNAGESLIVTEVEVCLHSINSHVALSVFVGVECSWVYVDVWVKLLNCNIVASGLKEFSY